MLKQKKLDITQTNIAHIGSDLDKKVRQAAGAHEAAWTNVGKAEGIEVFRIENFTVKKWSRPGEFYDGDSYIVVKTKKNSNGTFSWDIHFWLGKYTSQDEAGVAVRTYSFLLIIWQSLTRRHLVS
jgi:gelsolin